MFLLVTHSPSRRAHTQQDVVGEEVQVVRVFLAVRILRAARFVEFSHGLRKTAHAIVAAMKDIGGLFFIGVVVMYVRLFQTRFPMLIFVAASCFYAYPIVSFVNKALKIVQDARCNTFF